MSGGMVSELKSWFLSDSRHSHVDFFAGFFFFGPVACLPGLGMSAVGFTRSADGLPRRWIAGCGRRRRVSASFVSF